MSIQMLLANESPVYPGTLICKNSKELIKQEGVYVEGEHCIASVFGQVSHMTTEDGNNSIAVLPFNRRGNGKQIVSINLGDIVVGKVTKLEPHFAVIQVLSVNERNLTHKIEAMLKKEHAGYVSLDKFKMTDIVTPGDIVVAKVKSLSESKKILVGIESSELGVIISRGPTGELLIPISDEKMLEQSTNTKFRKKVACLQKSN